MGRGIFYQKSFQWRCLAIGAVLAFVLSGCRFYKESTAKLSSVEIDAVVAESIKQGSCMSVDDSENSWWELFQDPQLCFLISESLNQNPTLKMAQERVQLAQERSRQAYSPLLPSVDMNFEEAFAAGTWHNQKVAAPLPKNIIPKWVNFLSFFLNFKWRLDPFGKQRSMYLSVVDEVKMQQAESNWSALLISTQIAHSYFLWQNSLKMIQMSDQSIQLHQEMYALLEAQYALSIGMLEPVLQLEKAIGAIEKERLSYELQQAQALTQLNILMGRGAADPIELEVPQSQMICQFPVPKSLPIDFLMRRADVVAKLWQALAYSKRIKSAKLAFLPSIDLGSFSGFLNLQWDSLAKPSGWFTSILPGLSVPIFKGMELKSNLSYSVSRFNYAAHDYHATILSAAKEVVDSLMAFRIANEKLMLQEQRFLIQTEIVEIAKLRYEVGLNNQLEVLIRQMDGLQEEIDLENLSYLQMLSALSLVKSLGGGYLDSSGNENLKELEAQ